MLLGQAPPTISQTCHSASDHGTVLLDPHCPRPVPTYDFMATTCAAGCWLAFGQSRTQWFAPHWVAFGSVALSWLPLSDIHSCADEGRSTNANADTPCCSTNHLRTCNVCSRRDRDRLCRVLEPSLSAKRGEDTIKLGNREQSGRSSVNLVYIYIHPYG